MKLWTLRDANRALPLVKRIARDIVELVREMQSLHEIAESCKQRGSPDEARAALEQFRERGSRMERLEEEMSELGVELKDHRTGLLDFPAELDGETVLLCWKLGEDRIDHWHDLVSGFAGRKPVHGHFEA